MRKPINFAIDWFYQLNCLGRGRNTVRLGDKHGGWVIDPRLLNAEATCYSVGLGEDASFDLALIERFDCPVYVFDPTPRARAYAEQLMPQHPGFCFYPYGLWREDAIQRFYSPQNPAHVSHSLLNLQETDDYFDAQCRRLSSVMQELGHQRIDLLKLDIEGAEYAVIESFLEDGLTVNMLCVEYDEMHHPMDRNWVARLRGSVRRLKQAGYRLIDAEAGANLLFIHEKALKDAARR
jgi:FkbM family methyltransferase